MNGDPPVDPRAVPGSYEKTETGDFIRTDEPTLTADAGAGGPDLALEDLRAIAEASTAAGFAPPPQVAAAIEAAEAQIAEGKTAGRRRSASTNAAPPVETPPPATTPVEPPKE